MMLIAAQVLWAISMLIYLTAGIAFVSYPLRRILPVSPLELWGGGCFCFYVATALMVAGKGVRWLTS